ncbi:AaceriAEL159Wp [[Ashbya] aceris (nom. inval.)]|nr:AaceriAEL159Wp [[Ashbya] aceris (nom. inval.)]
MEDKGKAAMPRLPISKCKRIAKTDPDYIMTTQAAYIATAFATELFVQAISEDAMAQAQLDGRRAGGKAARLTYNDLARTVAREERYAFLADVIPETKTLAHLVRQNKVRYSAPLAQGQATLPFAARAADGGESEAASEDEEVEEGELQKDLAEVAKLNQVVDLDAESSAGEADGEEHEPEDD